MNIAIQILIVMGIANLLTNQVIGRRFVSYIMGSQTKQRKGLLQYIWEVVHCPSCLSVWVGIISIAFGFYWYVPLIAMLGSYIIEITKK